MISLDNKVLLQQILTQHLTNDSLENPSHVIPKGRPITLRPKTFWEKFISSKEKTYQNNNENGKKRKAEKAGMEDNYTLLNSRKRTRISL